MATGSARLEMVLDAIDRASGPIRDVQRALDRLERATASSSRQMASYGAAGERALRGIATAAAAAGAGAALVGKQIVSSAADFESALTEIQKKTGGTAQATLAIGEEIEALAISGRLAAPISEIAAAYERGAAAGLPIADLADFAELSVKGADAFGMSAEAVGNFSARLRTSLGMAASEVSETLDLVNSLADAGIADESGIVDYMDNAGATLKTLGFVKEESLALGATLLNLGMAQDVAATGSSALAGKMLTVGTLSGKNRKVFEKYMGSVDRFAGMVEKDANGALLTMLDRLNSISKTGRMEFLQAFVGAEWSDEMLRLVEGSEEYRRNLALAADESNWMGSLDKSYELKLDDFWSQWQIAQNNLEKLSIDLGTMAMPGVKLALSEAQGIVQEIGRNIAEFPALIDQEKLGQAGTALGEFKRDFEELLGIQTSNSQIDQFFTDIANATNGLSDTILAIAGAIKAVKEYLPGPTAEELASPTRPEDRMLGNETVGNIRLIEGGFFDMFGDIYERLFDRIRGLEPRINYDPAHPPWWVSQPAATAAPAPPRVYEPVSDAMGGIYYNPDPPNIVGPLETEGAEATQRAVEFGQQMTDALSITAEPIINVASIVGAKDQVDGLLASLRAVSAAMQAVPSVPTGGSATTVAIDGARAAGGPVRGGGLYLVGEEGPELFSPGRGGMIHTADATSRMLGPEIRSRRGLFDSIGAHDTAGSGGVGGNGGPVTIDASFHHSGDINYGSPQDKAEFEELLRKHWRAVMDVVGEGTRRATRTSM